MLSSGESVSQSGQVINVCTLHGQTVFLSIKHRSSHTTLEARGMKQINSVNQLIYFTFAYVRAL